MFRVHLSLPDPHHTLDAAPPATTAALFAALILSSFFLDYWGELLQPQPTLAPYLAFLAFASLVTVGLFYLLPVLALRAAGRPLYATLAAELGTVPTVLIRCAVLVFGAAWIAHCTAFPLASLIAGLNPWVVRGLQLSLFALLGATILQPPSVHYRAALFSAKLGLAIVIAGFVRTREALPAVRSYVYARGDIHNSWALDWRDLCLIAGSLAPFLLCASAWGVARPNDRPVRTALLGFALPLWLILGLVVLGATATGLSPLHRPSLAPSILMAVTSGIAASASPAIYLILALAMFGAIRFTFRAMADAVAMPSAARRAAPYLFTVIVTAPVLAMHLSWENRLRILDGATYLLTNASAILAAGLVARGKQPNTPSLLDPAAILALVAGLAAPWYLPEATTGSSYDAWWRPALLPSAGIAFFLCLALRTLQHRNRSRAHQ